MDLFCGVAYLTCHKRANGQAKTCYDSQHDWALSKIIVSPGCNRIFVKHLLCSSRKYTDPNYHIGNFTLPPPPHFPGFSIFAGNWWPPHPSFKEPLCVVLLMVGKSKKVNYNGRRNFLLTTSAINVTLIASTRLKGWRLRLRKIILHSGALNFA